MRLAKISIAGRTAAAVIETGDIARVIGPWTVGEPLNAPFDVAQLSLQELHALIERSSETLPLSNVTLSAPISRAAKIICLGINYLDHAAEASRDRPENPSLFLRFADSFVGHEEPLIRPTVSSSYDFEGEIAVIIGKAGRHISLDQAGQHIFGYTNLMDGSLRDYQGHSVTAGKNFWQSGAIGPWITTRDCVGNWRDLNIQTRVSGECMQSSTGHLMIYGVEQAIEYVSRWTPLLPGDVISTGTPGGVGAVRKPPRWLVPGDVVEVDVSSLGVLRNRVISEVEHT